MQKTIPMDENIKFLVDYINKCDGLETVGSCGGHKNRKFYQAKYNHFYVDFVGERDEVDHFVRFISECEEVPSLEITMRSTMVGEIYYRLQGTLKDAEIFRED